MELVPDLYLYLFLLLFAVFVRCTVAVCWLALSHTRSRSHPLKLVLLEIETQIKGRNQKVWLPVGWFVVAGELSHRGCSKFLVEITVVH